MVGKICTVCKKCSFTDKKLSFFTYPGDPQRYIKYDMHNNSYVRRYVIGRYDYSVCNIQLEISIRNLNLKR